MNEWRLNQLENELDRVRSRARRAEAELAEFKAWHWHPATWFVLGAGFTAFLSAMLRVAT
jgi:hypothetical protein